MRKARLEDVQEDGTLAALRAAEPVLDMVSVTDDDPRHKLILRNVRAAIAAGTTKDQQLLTLRAALMVIKELAVESGRDPMEVLLEAQKIAEEALLYKSTAKQDCGS